MFGMSGDRSRIAFFGGTFDPVHRGHLEMAHIAVEKLQLDRLYFIPAGRNPLKANSPKASNRDRLNMIKLAIEGESQFSVWEGELQREGPSYTLHTVRFFEECYPGSRLFWLIGADQLPFLHHWYGINELIRKIGFILVKRPGYDTAMPRIPGIFLYPVNNPLVPVSATEIRARLKIGQSVDNLVPAPVADYLAKNQLYT
jgi:nicotinate-nucleotide adenylyltransferase